MSGRERWQRAPLTNGLALTVMTALVGIAGLASGTASGLQEQAVDLLQPGTEASDDIVMVAIDRRTLASADASWPWPRRLHAELIDRINRDQPEVIVYNVLFADDAGGDATLAAAVARAPVVLPTSLALDASTSPPRVVTRVDVVPGIEEAATAIGHSNVTVSPGRGVVRTLPLYAVDERGGPVASLALAAVAVADGAPTQLIERRGGVQVGDRFVPLDGAELRVNWASGFDIDRSIAAVDVLGGTVDPSVFADRIVVVGVTEPTLGDLHLVPVDKSGGAPGLSVHANAINTMLQRSYLTEQDLWAEAVLVLGVSALAAAAYTFAPLWIGGATTVLLAAAVLFWSAWRFQANGELWNVVWPLAALIVAAAGGVLIRYFGEIRHRRRAAAMFARYVPAGTLDDLADPKALVEASQGTRLDVTVLFCDLRGFTPIAAELEPGRVRELLDRYYDHVVTTVLAHGGTVMQFVGDEVFTVFGAPVATEHDTIRAVECARALVRELPTLDEELRRHGLPVVRYGIGLHRGPVVAAHVGTDQRRQYAVVGDAVNVGSRLCGRAGAGEIVASADVVALGVSGTDDGFERLGDLALKGVDRPVSALRVRVVPPAG